MAKYWSASSSSIWDSAICDVSAMPSDKVALTDSEYSDLMAKQAQGYKIVNNTSTGKPQAVAQGLTEATATEHEGVAATGSVLGHVKLSDSTSSSSGASAGVAATPAAVKAVNDAKAPTSHASTATTYGAGTGTNYGHVKLSDSTGTTSGASAGVAATPTAVKAAYDKAVTVDNNAVHKTGNETIAGEKTFSTTPIVENAAPAIRFIDTELVKGTNPSALNYSNSGWFDKNSKWLGFYGYQVEADGTAKTYLGTYEFDAASDSAENRAHLGVEYPKNGTAFGFAPSTPSGATSNEIATAGWIKNTATAAKAATLETARTIRTNLASTATASFDGSGNVTPGVTGVLPVANGGTGSSTQNFVDLSTNQTVGGGKTFTGNVNIKKSGPYHTLQNSDITKGTAPSASASSTITFGSSGGTNAANALAMLQNTVDASGNNIIKLVAYDPTASSTTNAGLQITYPKGGTPTFALGGKNVVRSVNGTAADAAGNVKLAGAYVTEAWKSTDGEKWYRKWSDGWIEQGGTTSSGGGQTITFPQPFSSDLYHFLVTPRLNNTAGVPVSAAEYVNTRTSTSAKVTLRWDGGDNVGVYGTWYACGY